MPRTDVLTLLVAVSLGACTPDERPLLSECEHGRYWAECGGNGDPVVGCDRATGECRWFAGGETAYGHAVSSCPPDDVCCLGGWPFDDWAPTGALLEHARDDLGTLKLGMASRSHPSDAPVLYDDLGGREHFTSCGVIDPGCLDAYLYWRVRAVGESIVLSAVDAPWVAPLEIELLPDDGTGRHARIYVHSRGCTDCPDSPPNCGVNRGEEFEITSGALHLSTDRFDDLDAIHGRFEGIGPTGLPFLIEF